MSQVSPLFFPPFRLDLLNACVWQGEQALLFRPKAFAVLLYLAQRAGQLVSKDELLAGVWPDTYVTDNVLKGCIREIRQILSDSAASPHIIATVHRRGYRFIAPISAQPQDTENPYTVPFPTSQPSAASLVGRAHELSQLQGWLETALQGERQFVFMTGEPGIGKTTLVDAFLEQVVTTQRVYLASGQCIQHYGVSEGYRPVLEAVSRLCQEPGRAQLSQVLRRVAPTLMVQLPALLSDVDREQLQRQLLGTTRERMLREMAEALEAISAEIPLILRLEDLQWSDYSTLDLLSLLARRRDSARLLVIGTYRPAEVRLRNHPLRALKQDLQLHDQCHELSLSLLNEKDISSYLRSRFVPHDFPATLARMMYRRTEGNPLFLVNIVTHLMAQQLLVQHEGRWRLQEDVEVLSIGTPANLRLLIEHTLEQLSGMEQQVLETASVVGVEFSAAAVAAGLQKDVAWVEHWCAHLSRQEQFLDVLETETWPDGTVTACYRFRHALYQNELYQQITPTRRGRLHQRIGEQLAAAYGQQAGQLAGVLARHFEQGRDYGQAVTYLQKAGDNAVRKHAYQEAAVYLRKGVMLVQRLPDTAERCQRELHLQATLGPVLMMTSGYVGPEVKRAYDRARELCQQVDEMPQLVPVLRGLVVFYYVRAEYQAARELAEQCHSLAQRCGEQEYLLEGHAALASVFFFLGECSVARAHLEHGFALYNPQNAHTHIARYGQDPGMGCLSYLALVLWILGYPDQAVQRSDEAIALGHSLSHAFSFARTRLWAAILHQFRREWQAVQTQSQETIALATQQEVALWEVASTILQGRALVALGSEMGGDRHMHQGVERLRAIGVNSLQPYFLGLQAEAYGDSGQGKKGLKVVTEALDRVRTTGERFYEAELHRLKGILLLGAKDRGLEAQRHNSSEAETCFRQAIEIAHRQQAKSLELRAATSLARLWQQQGKKAKARNLLAPVYGWFTEGFDTADLRDAKALLDELA